MSSVKVEVVRTEDAEGTLAIELRYEGRKMETWVDLLRAMQQDMEFELILHEGVEPEKSESDLDFVANSPLRSLL